MKDEASAGKYYGKFEYPTKRNIPNYNERFGGESHTFENFLNSNGSIIDFTRYNVLKNKYGSVGTKKFRERYEPTTCQKINWNDRKTIYNDKIIRSDFGPGKIGRRIILIIHTNNQL